MEDKLVAYGGQAVIEGVMMRGRKACAVAMRAPDGTIATKVEELGGIYKSRLAKIPFLRGLIMLWDSLGLGMRALTDSANLQTGEDEKLEGPALYLTLGLTFLVAIGIFFLAPAGVGWLSERFLHWNAWWSNLLEGVLRLAFVAWLFVGDRAALTSPVFLLITVPSIRPLMPYEAGAEMTPASVAGFSVEHPRCGTAFLLTLMVLSLFFFTILGPLPFAWRLDQPGGHDSGPCRVWHMNTCAGRPII